MTDPASQNQPAGLSDTQIARISRTEAIELIELLFFAYRDFVAEPDAILAEYGFGRAHHRVLHFVSRNPGLTVAELLDILKITKQSLARVLRQLVDEGFIVQETGTADRRQRHLHVSRKGAELAQLLLERQIARVSASCSMPESPALPEERQKSGATFLRGLIDAGERTKVLNRIASGHKAAKSSD